MENQNLKKEEVSGDENMWNAMEKSHRRGKIMGGILVVAIGALFLARELGAEIPFWVFSWKMLLIGIGLILAVKHKFLHPGWFVLIAVGGAFLLTDIYPDMEIKPILWPSLIILAGLFIIFKPRRKRKFGQYRKHWKKWHEHNHGHHHRWEKWDRCEREEEPVNGDLLESVSIMAGIKKNILTKTFKGGEIVNVFGGSEINLTQADFEGKVTIEITQVFGGTRLIVPANWEIRSEQTVTVFGNVEDRRPTPQKIGGEPAKILVITGTTVFGGIDVRSY